MKKLSNNTNQSIKKLENWFKHKRRKEMKNGNLTFSVFFPIFLNISYFLEKKNLFHRRQKVFDEKV